MSLRRTPSTVNSKQDSDGPPRKGELDAPAERQWLLIPLQKFRLQGCGLEFRVWGLDVEEFIGFRVQRSGFRV